MKKQQLQLESMADFVLAEAKKAGASDSVVVIDSSQGVEISIRKGQVEELSGAQARALSLTVYVGKKSASASTSNLTKRSLAKFIKQTVSVAKHAEEDDTDSLADPQYLAKKPLRDDLDLFDPRIAQVSTADKIALALEAERASFAYDKRIVNSSGASFSDSTRTIVIGNSRGFTGSVESSTCSLGIACVASENDQMQAGSWSQTSRFFSGIGSAAEIGKIAAQRALRQLGARKVKTQMAPVIYDPLMASRLIGQFVGAASGGHIYRKSSFLVDRLGELVSVPGLYIIDNPFLKGCLGSRPFDGDCLEPSARYIVKDGILNCYLMDPYSARKLGCAPNGGSTSNLYVGPGSKSADEIIATVANGLYVTSVTGLGFNVMTGDYSVGASGLWIENGKLSFPVNGITIASNMLDMFRNIEAIGSDLVFRARTNAPTIKIASMHISGE